MTHPSPFRISLLQRGEVDGRASCRAAGAFEGPHHVTRFGFEIIKTVNTKTSSCQTDPELIDSYMFLIVETLGKAEPSINDSICHFCSRSLRTRLDTKV